MEHADQPQRMSEAEMAQLRQLLRRYCAQELDQWEALRTETPYGSVYITLSRGRPEGTDESAYRPL
ncbi:hypothetical protein [Streptomyces rimosus]|uniref:hypothetical protein n=1 Tax=Streptomyces rimosus TaxID=1927 RepID=UPI0004CBA7C2|nr:hypothetical protein [Streptomyces rimosus]